MLRPSWLVTAAFACVLTVTQRSAAQEPTPAPTPAPRPAQQEPQPATTETPRRGPGRRRRPGGEGEAPAAAGSEAPATSTAEQEPQGEGTAGQGTPGQDTPGQATPGQGPQGRSGRGGRGRDSGQLRLPEFTPVAAPPVAGLQGKQYFWFTMYPDFLVQFDPASDTVTKKVKLVGGLFWSTTLTHDQKRMLVVTNQQQSIEVVDLQKGELAGTHLFQEEGFILRIRQVRECPGGVLWLVQTDRVKKEIDRYSFEPSQWLLYDSAQQKVVQKVRSLPQTLDRGARLSADGTHWVANDRDGDVVFYDARTFEEQGRIDLHTPRFFGAGALRLSGTDLLDGRDPKRARMLFTSQDPVEKARSLWGVVELDLENRRVADVTEWGMNRQSWGMQVAHKKLVGAMMGRGGREGETRLALIDLTNGRQIAEAYHEFRPRRSLVAISPDGDKVYVGVAGSDFEVFDQKLQRLPSVELDGEIVGRIHVVDG